MPKGHDSGDDKIEVSFDSPLTGPISVELEVVDDDLDMPREEYFSDNSGIITLKLGFDRSKGFFVNELWYPEEGKTIGQNTGIIISNLSRIRADELTRQLYCALRTFQSVEGVILKFEIDELVADLNRKVSLLAAEPGDFRRSVDTKYPIYKIVKALDKCRDDVLGSQRKIVLDVLMNDHRLQRCTL